MQDGIKFPDFVHAVKPEPDTEIPTGATAHDTFWDFVSLVPESAHAVIWAMSDRAIPRNLRSIQGFGVHTFRLINAEGKSHFVKFHWTPKQGLSALVWDEAQNLQVKTRISTVVIFMKQLSKVFIQNGNSACRLSKKKMK